MRSVVVSLLRGGQPPEEHPEYGELLPDLDGAHGAGPGQEAATLLLATQMMEPDIPVLLSSINTISMIGLVSRRRHLASVRGVPVLLPARVRLGQVGGVLLPGQLLQLLLLGQAAEPYEEPVHDLGGVT